MRSSPLTKELLQQFERALALMEAQQTLETERRSLSAEARASDTEALYRRFNAIDNYMLETVKKEHEAIESRLKDVESHVSIEAVAVLTKLSELGEKLDRLYEIVGIPRDNTTPTLAEQLNAAQSDPSVRKQIQQLFAEMEFENTEVEYG
jgi:hypothetical protein